MAGLGVVGTNTPECVVNIIYCAVYSGPSPPLHRVLLQMLKYHLLLSIYHDLHIEVWQDNS